MNILLTGGASGLGEAITKTLARNLNDTVHFTYCHSADMAKNMESKFPNTRAIKCNFHDSSDVEKLALEIPERDIHVLINNAFTTEISGKHFHKITLETFEDSFRFNVMPTIKITQAAIELFRKKKSGKIITILSSYVVNKPPVGCSDYVAIKAYLASLNKSWANENANFNITANCVSPSFMQTAMTAGTDTRVLEQLTESHPLRKLLTVEETADTVAFLVYGSSQINGANIIINSAADVV